jgi:hypothetical protein
MYVALDAEPDLPKKKRKGTCLPGTRSVEIGGHYEIHCDKAFLAGLH